MPAPGLPFPSKPRPRSGSNGRSRGLTQKENLPAITRTLKKLKTIIMEPKPPFLKGKLTAISVAGFIATQLPGIIQDLMGSSAVFSDAANASFSVLSLVAAAGTIWGAGRRAFNYFGK